MIDNIYVDFDSNFSVKYILMKFFQMFLYNMFLVIRISVIKYDNVETFMFTGLIQYNTIQIFVYFNMYKEIGLMKLKGL